MKKVVLKVDLYDDRTKQKAMKKVSGLSGVESVSVDMKEKKLAVVGEMDPIRVVGKLKKLCHAEMVSVGPAKEDEKPDDKEYSINISDPLTIYEAYPLYSQMRPPLYNQCYYVGSVEEHPHGCVIC